MMLTLRLCLVASVLVSVLVFGGWCLDLGLGLEDCCLVNNTDFIRNNWIHKISSNYTTHRPTILIIVILCNIRTKYHNCN